MTRNRTALDTFPVMGSQLMIVLLVALAMGISVIEYFVMAREQVRRVEVRLRRRAARRVAE